MVFITFLAIYIISKGPIRIYDKGLEFFTYETVKRLTYLKIVDWICVPPKIIDRSFIPLWKRDQN